MRRSPLRVVALACLLVTSGCLGVLGGATTTPTDADPRQQAVSPTLSPMDSPSPTATPPGIGLPEGVNATGIDSPERIAAAHNASLWNTSFTIRYVGRRTTRTLVERRTVGVIRYDGDGTVSYNYTTIESGRETLSRRHTQGWSNESTAYRRIETDNGTTVTEIDPLSLPPTFADRIELFFRSFETDVTGYSRLGGEPVVRVSAPELSSPRSSGITPLEGQALQLGFSRIRSGSFSADLADGVVRRYRVRIIGFGRAERRSLTDELVFTGIGTTTVDRPEWIGVANDSQAGRSRSAYQPRSRTRR